MQSISAISLGLFLSLSGLGTVMAGEPSEVVRPFYLQPGLELEMSAREQFIDPAHKILNLNDEIRQGGDEGCLDPSLPFNDSDYDPAVIAKTLTLKEVATDKEATVLATFMASDNAQSVQWRLKNVDGSWRIFDIVSMTKDWALSRFQCE